MRDWIIAIFSGVILMLALFVLAPVMALLAVFLIPALLLIAASMVIWFLLQIIKDPKFNDKDKNGS